MSSANWSSDEGGKAQSGPDLNLHSMGTLVDGTNCVCHGAQRDNGRHDGAENEPKHGLVENKARRAQSSSVDADQDQGTQGRQSHSAQTAQDCSSAQPAYR